MQIGRKDILWSYIAQGLRWGNSLLILPLVLRIIPSEQLAFWYLFATINSLVMLFDLGFSATIVRNVTYVFSGVKELLIEGFSQYDKQNEEIDATLLQQVIKSSIYIYKLISSILFVFLAVLGTYYVSVIIDRNLIQQTLEIWIAWVLTVINTIATFYYLYLNSLLLGRGYVKQVQIATVVTNILSLCLTFAGLLLGFGIVAMALSALISLVINRLICKRFFYNKELNDILQKADVVSKEKRKEIVSVMWFNAKKTGLVALGGFLITKIGQFFVTSFFTLSVAAQYGLTMQIITVVSGLAVTYMTVMYPKITHDFYRCDMDSVRKHFGLTVTVIFITFTFCCLGLLFLGEPLLIMMKSKTPLLPRLQIATLFLVYFLENQHAAFSSIHTIQNRVPFVKPALISGGVILLLTYIVFTIWNPNIWYLILIQFVIQLAYNNWKWIYDACKILDMNFFAFYKIGFFQLYNMFKIQLIR